MSVSVLGVAGSDPFRASLAACVNDPAAVSMNGPASSLKRPRDTQHSLARGPQSLRDHVPSAPEPGSRSSLFDPIRSPHYETGTVGESAPPRSSSRGSLTYPETAIEAAGPTPLQYKRSRFDTPASPAAHDAGVSQSQMRRLSAEHASILSAQSMSPRDASPQSHMPEYAQGPSGFGHLSRSPMSGPSASGAIQSQSGRPTLPPTSTLLSPILPSATHLQNLQHEISTKSLAYNNLAEEHERLLAAYSRLQARLAALDRKSKTADGELTVLQEERIILQERVESLERDIDELQSARDSETEQRGLESEQWRKIIDLSGAVQRRHTKEGEDWKTEKESLLKRVAGLEGEIRHIRSGLTDSDAVAVVPTGAEAVGQLSDHLSQAPENPVYEVLRDEIRSLRSQTGAANRLLDEYRHRMDEVNKLLSRAASLAAEGQQDSRPPG